MPCEHMVMKLCADHIHSGEGTMSASLEPCSSDVLLQEYEYFYLICIMIHVISITINAGLPDLGFRDLHGAAGVELGSLIIYTYADCFMFMYKAATLKTPMLALLPCRDRRYVCQSHVTYVCSPPV